MRYGYNEPVFGNLFQKIHYKHAVFAVERARRFVREDHFRVVYDRPRYRNPLHFPARKLGRFFTQMLRKPDFNQSVDRAFFAFLAGNSAYRKRGFHVFEYRLMRNEVITLKHEPDLSRPVSVPVLFAEFFRGLAGYIHIPAVVTVQPPDNVQERRFSATRRTEHANEFRGAELERNVSERLGFSLVESVCLFYTDKFYH